MVDGIEIGRAPVTVTTLGAEFIKGLQGSRLVADFPRAGEQVRVVWQESQQNFVLAPTELGAALTPAPSSGGIEGMLENPRPASYQSGIGVISGWVCAAEAGRHRDQRAAHRGGRRHGAGRHAGPCVATWITALACW